jgi:hypothetical protein
LEIALTLGNEALFGRQARRFKLAFNLVSLSVGLALFVLVLRFSGMPALELLGKAAAIKWPYILVILASMFLQAVLTAKRWKLLLGGRAQMGAWPKGFIFYNSNMGLLFTTFVPVLGYVGAKAASAKIEQNIPVSQTIFATSLEYLVGFEVILVMLIPSVLHLLGVLSGRAGIFALLAVFAVFLVAVTVFPEKAVDWPRTILARWLDKLAHVSVFKNRLGPAALRLKDGPALGRTISRQVLILSAWTYAVIFTRYFAFLKAFRIPLAASDFSLLYPLGYAFSSLGITPSNLGASELGWFALIFLGGAGREGAALYAVGQRVLNIGAVLVLALASYIIYAFQKRRS